MALTPPILTTDRLDMRPPVASDFAAVLTINAQPATGRYLGSTSSVAEQFLRFCRSAGSWPLYGYGSFVIRRRDADAVIGNCGIFHTWRDLGPDFDDHPEAGWVLGAEHTGRGLAEEAMRAVLAWFDGAHGPRRTVCMIDPRNAASIKLAGKLGFAPFRDANLANGEAVTLFERPVAP
jgi:RimJ/RimL family protein N-acetyltransferase